MFYVYDWMLHGVTCNDIMTEYSSQIMRLNVIAEVCD